MNFTNKIVWITGASSGIGEALTYAFVKAGAKVIASARRAEELKRVKAACAPHQDRVQVVPLDLADSGSLRMIADQVLRDHRRIDILVNNGGISQRALAVEADLEVDRRIMEVNYFGQVALTKAVLPFMLQQGDGHLVVLSSLTGKFGFPLRSAYAASKHALHGFFETLWLENRDHGLRVTMVNPGRIRTQVSVNALTKDGTPSGEMDPGQAKGMSAKKCAHQILAAVHRNQFELTIGSLGEQFMVWLKRHFPGLFHALVRKVAAR